MAILYWKIHSKTYLAWTYYIENNGFVLLNVFVILLNSRLSWIQICLKSRCSQKARYNYQSMPAQYCRKHAEPKMISVYDRPCLKKGCVRAASYNYLGSKADFCGEHKDVDMVNVRYVRCVIVGCSKAASFNFKGQPARYCGDHKLKDMENVRAVQCVRPKCPNIARFNIEGQPARYCRDHADKSIMKDLRKVTCIVDGCPTGPSFNWEGLSPRYCAKHKHPLMENVVAQRCIYKDCTIQPRYNKDGEKSPLYCTAHKEKGMVNIVDARCITCHEHGNVVIASFGLEGKRATHCQQHGAILGLKCVRRAFCTYPNCETTRCFNFEVWKEVYSYIYVYWSDWRRVVIL